MKITQEQYDQLIAMRPEDRVGPSSSPFDRHIYGILFAFSKSLELRDGHLDIITAEAAHKEIKNLIKVMMPSPEEVSILAAAASQKDGQ